MDRKSFRFDVKSLDDAGAFEGYISVFGNKDSVGDIVDPGAFTKTLLEQQSFPLLWQHNADEPIGSFTASEDGHGLKVAGQLVLAVQKAREAYELRKADAIKGMSFGYDTIKHTMESGSRHLKELKLWEGSFVTFPANPLAEMTAVKGLNLQELLDMDMKDVSPDLVKQVIDRLQALIVTEPGIPTQPGNEPQLDALAALLADCKSLTLAQR